MAHGTPDYGVTAGVETVYQVRDLGELAARLGSPITYDRSGDVIWWEDFECGLAKWNFTHVNGVGSNQLSTAKARNGRNSLQSITAAGASAAEVAQHQMAFPSLSLLGLEASWLMQSSAGAPRIEIFLQDGAQQQAWAIKWDASTDELSYQTAGGFFTVFGEQRLNTVAQVLFHTAKLVVNPIDGRYERFILDNERYDLSAAIPLISATATPSQLIVSLRNVTTDGAARTMYWDDVIVTQNEPRNG